MCLNTYLTFSGNCREAMTFYQKCLGGELTFQTVGESPMAGRLPVQMKACILHSTLIKPGLVLMGSDMVSEDGLLKGNSVSMMLHCYTEDETRSLYEKLSEGGKQTNRLEHTYWGALFGNLTDRYGHHWLLNYQAKQ